MPFEKGHSLATGRPGSNNKSTEIVKKNVAVLLENNIQLVQEDLDSMKPRDRVNALLQFMKFVIPTQKAVEVDNRVSQEELNENYINRLMEIPEENFDKLDG